MYREFPDGFYWGASTSAHQVEADTENHWTRWERANADRLAAEASERHGDSPVWHEIADAATDPANYVSGRAVAHDERYAADFDLAARLGHTAHRFSVEWSRVMPEPDRIDADALAHYRDVARALSERGIEPFVTLWHFTNPTWFADRGGWADPDFDAFATYVRRVVEALDDHVSHWLTVNEPEVYASCTRLAAEWPPARRNPLAYLRVRRNLVRAHRIAARTIRDVAPDANVGVAVNHTNFSGDGTLSRAFARIAHAASGGLDLRWMAGTLDFVGLNFYRHQPVRAGIPPFPETDAPRSDLGWELRPTAIDDVLRRIARHDLPIVVTENGLADRRDRYREWFLRQSIDAIGRAIDDGVDVRGYLHWSLLDNFEWDKGFWPRFGLLAVDRESEAMTRTVRPSAFVYADVARRNGLADPPPEPPDGE